MQPVDEAASTFLRLFPGYPSANNFMHIPDKGFDIA
jgi:hypothetical protein